MSRLRRHFGTAGLLVAVVALAAAVGGSAVAANSGNDATASAKKGKNRKGGGNVNKLIKREARKFSKVFSQRFAKRFPGPIGPQGFPGLPGAPGEDGDDGDDGSDGSNGSPGKDGATGPTGPTGPTGDEGPTGPTGFSGFTSTLPEGETETGVWSFSLLGVPTPNGAQVPISFNIPLEAKIDSFEKLVDVAREEEACEEEATEAEEEACFAELAEKCPGTVAEPDAKAGFLCVYQATMAKEPAFPPSFTNLAVSGVILNFAFLEEGAAGTGSWAVTAPETS